jgi:hypothetical protein
MRRCTVSGAGKSQPTMIVLANSMYGSLPTLENGMWTCANVRPSRSNVVMFDLSKDGLTAPGGRQ